MSAAQAWKSVSLEAVAQIVNGGTPRSDVTEYWGGDVQWLTPKDMGQMRIREIASTPRALTQTGLQNSSARQVPENSIILSTRAPIGHLAINKQPMAFNQGCRGIVPGDHLDHLFLYYFLLANRSELDELGTGATFKELSAGALRSFEIPLPPMDEQKRIVAVLDRAFAALDQAHANAEANLADAENLLALALRKSIFGAQVNDPSRYLYCSLGDVIAEIRNGVNCDQKSGGHDRISRIETIASGVINVDRVGYSTLSPQQKQKARLLRGDILFSHINSIPHIGKTAILDENIDLYHGINLLLIRPISAVYPAYLNLFFRTLKATKYWEPICRKSVNQASVNQQDIAKVPFFYPELRFQREVCERIADIENQAERIAASYRDQIKEVAQIRQSLLQTAFSGQLT